MEKRDTIKKGNFTLYFLAIMEISIYFLTYEMRTLVFKDNLFEINFIFIFIFVCLIFISKNIEKVNLIIIMLLILLSLLILVNSFAFNISIKNIVKMITIVIAPLSLISIKIKQECFSKFILLFMKIFNLIFIVVILLGVIDYISGAKLQQILLSTNYIFNKYLVDVVYKKSIYRFYCFLGHPLTIAKYSLMFFIINNIYSRYYNKTLINKYLVIILTLLGVVLSSSKTGIILSLILILLFTNVKKRKFLFYAIIISLLIIVINSDFFLNTVGARFVESLNNGDISSGRNMLLEKLINSNYRFEFLTMHGMGYSGVISQSFATGITNFEYPPIMFMFDYGIVGTIIIYLVILIYPIKVFIMNKDYYILINFIIFSMMCNSYNSIATAGDGLLQLTFLIFILINISNKNNYRMVK